MVDITLNITPQDGAAIPIAFAVMLGSLVAVAWAVVGGWSLLRALLEGRGDDDE